MALSGVTKNHAMVNRPSKDFRKYGEIFFSTTDEVIIFKCKSFKRMYPEQKIASNSKSDRTPPKQIAVDGCYARLLLMYTYRGLFTTTQGQSTC